MARIAVIITFLCVKACTVRKKTRWRTFAVALRVMLSCIHFFVSTARPRTALSGSFQYQSNQVLMHVCIQSKLELESLCVNRGAPFTFTYNRGYGECKYPLSRVDSCTENSRLLLRYQACPEVPKTESTGENCTQI